MVDVALAWREVPHNSAASASQVDIGVSLRRRDLR